MEIDSIRAFCLSLPRAREQLQWGETLCFKAGEKIFATLNLDVASSTRLAFKCTPEKFAELMEREGLRPAPYVGRYHWAALEELDALPADELVSLIRVSYEMVAGKTRATAGRRPGGKASSLRKPRSPR